MSDFLNSPQIADAREDMKNGKELVCFTKRETARIDIAFMLMEKHIAELESIISYLADKDEYCPQTLSNDIGSPIPWTEKPECATCINQEHKKRCLTEWWTELARSDRQ